MPRPPKRVLFVFSELSAAVSQLQNGQDKARLTTLLAKLHAALGSPAAEPDRRVTHVQLEWRSTGAQQRATLAQAAALLGVRPRTLSVYLAQGGGAHSWSRDNPTTGLPDVLTARRIGTLDAVVQDACQKDEIGAEREND